jgi:hypothetical protein
MWNKMLVGVFALALGIGVGMATSPGTSFGDVAAIDLDDQALRRLDATSDLDDDDDDDEGDGDNTRGNDGTNGGNNTGDRDNTRGNDGTNGGNNTGDRDNTRGWRLDRRERWHRWRQQHRWWRRWHRGRRRRNRRFRHVGRTRACYRKGEGRRSGGVLPLSCPAGRDDRGVTWCTASRARWERASVDEGRPMARGPGPDGAEVIGSPDAAAFDEAETTKLSWRQRAVRPQSFLES